MARHSGANSKILKAMEIVKKIIKEERARGAYLIFITLSTILWVSAFSPSSEKRDLPRDQPEAHQGNENGDNLDETPVGDSLVEPFPGDGAQERGGEQGERKEKHRQG